MPVDWAEGYQKNPYLIWTLHCLVYTGSYQGTFLQLATAGFCCTMLSFDHVSPHFSVSSERQAKWGERNYPSFETVELESNRVPNRRQVGAH